MVIGLITASSPTPAPACTSAAILKINKKKIQASKQADNKNNPLQHQNLCQTAMLHMTREDEDECDYGYNLMQPASHRKLPQKTL